MDEAAPFQRIGDPMEKLLAGMEFYIHLFEDPHLRKSCLAGTTVQESAETNPKLCDAANVCIANQEKRFKARLDEACSLQEPAVTTRHGLPCQALDSDDPGGPQS